MKIFPEKKAIVADVKDLVEAELTKKDFSRSQLVPNCAKVVLPFDVPTVETLYDHDIRVEGPIKYEYEFKWHKPLPLFKHLFRCIRLF